MRCNLYQLRYLAAAVAAIFLCVHSASAEIVISFEESAPKDRFFMSNRSSCDIDAGSITIDLSSSTSELFFDTDPSGPGENVAQPFEIERTKKVSATSLPVPDGASSAEIRFRDFLPGGEIVATVDLDDSVPSGPRGVQMIDASELAGVRVTVATNAGARHTATFNEESRVSIELTGCRGN
jgi:hypothetical protein